MLHFFPILQLSEASLQTTTKDIEIFFCGGTGERELKQARGVTAGLFVGLFVCLFVFFFFFFFFFFVRERHKV